MARLALDVGSIEMQKSGGRRASVTIETADPELAWVNDGIFIAVGGRWSSGVSYDVYLVA